MDPASRTIEIASLGDCLRAPATVANALASADSLFNLFRLLSVDRPGAAGLDHYLESRSAYADVGTRSLELALFGLFCGRPPTREDAVELAVKLSEPVESGYQFENIAAIFVECFGPNEATRLLHAAALREGRNPAARIAAYSAALARTSTTAALMVADRACVMGPDPVGSLARWRDHLQRQIVAAN
jgi:hypothetical protein